MSASDGLLKSAQFRREREASWRELEFLVERVEKAGLRSLSAAELNRLPVLYRGAASALSVARAISLDRGLESYLSALVARAHLSVYGSDRSLAAAGRDYLLHGFPAAVRAHGRFLLVAFCLLLAGILTGYRQTAADPERLYTFVDEEMAEGRNTASTTAELKQVLYSGREHEGSALAWFASFLFTHNAKVGLLCFALGFAAAAPIPFVLFLNGAALGALWALYAAHGLGFEFFAWVFPHGVTELLAILLCAAAGLALGSALVFPGRHGRLHELGLAGRRAAPMVVGAVAMFFLAALIEGFFRQRVPFVSVRIGLAALTAGLWFVYFGFVRQVSDDRP